MGTVSGRGNETMKRKRYSGKFQKMAVERMKTSDDVSELAFGGRMDWLGQAAFCSSVTV
jgi:hypothetical protein